MKCPITSRLCALGVILLVAVPSTVFGASPVQVNAADPSSAPQGTVSLDVVVSGSGFDSSAAVSFFVTGTTNPGGVTVKNVTVLGSKKLIAKIDVADAAAIDNFDIQVHLSGGRKGKGTSLFRVTAKASDPCSTAGLDFPAFSYRTSAGTNQQIYLADASGACAKPVYLVTASSSFPPVLAYPIAGTSNRGRLLWWENILTLVALDFTVSGTVVAAEPKRTLFTADPGGAWGLEMSRDGTYMYTATATNVVERISVDNPLNRVVLRSFAHDTRRTRVDSVNGDESALYLNERVIGVNGVTLRTELVRLDLITQETTVLATTPDISYLYETVADPDSNRITYIDYLAGGNNCFLIQIADGTTGTLLSYGQPRFGRFPTWHGGKIIVNGYKPPDRRMKCANMDMITEVDPDSSAQRDLTRGNNPDGS